MGSTGGSLMNFGSTSGGAGGGGAGGGGRGGGSSEFGMVLQTAVKPGVKVRKGQVVAEFDQYMLLRLEDYRASVTQMEATVRKLHAELEVDKKAHQQTIENAKAALERARLDLKTIPVLGTIDAERTRLTAEEADARYKQLLGEVKFVEAGQRAQLKGTEIEFEQAKLELKRAEANADRMLMKAPIDGLAVMQTTFRGTEFAQIQPGDQLWPGMMFMQVVDTSSMIVTAFVNQVDVDTLKIGAKATIRFDAYPDLVLPGHVHSIGAMTKAGGMRANFVKEIPVQLKLDKMDPRVIPDLSVSADVVLEQEEKATIAPLASIFRDESGSAPYVFVKQGEAWERRSVQIGIINNTSASIHSGLRPGEVIATSRPPEIVKKPT
ncbi:MAG: HlyD family efflux transporter periplasmic adaptor subunit [Bryobacteraceae bacterium]